MNVKKIEKKVFQRVFNIYRSIIYRKYFRKCCRELGIDYHKSAPGEERWLAKWSGLPVKPSPLYYRLFYNFCGENERIITEEICRSVFELALNPPRYVKYYEDKNMYDKIINPKYTPQSVLRRMQGFYYDENYECQGEIDDIKLREILDASGYSRFIVKPTVDTNSGKGVLSISKTETKGYILDKYDIELTVLELQKYEGRDFVIQPFVESCEFMKKFCSTSANTIRLNTYRSVIDDEIHILPGALFRVGKEGSVTDNTHDGGMYVGINSDGSLKHEIFDAVGNSYSEVNGISLDEDYILPGFEEAKALCIDVAKSIHHHRIVSYDIIITEDEKPLLVEFNTEAFSIWGTQYTGVAGFGEYTDEIIEYCRQHVDEFEMCRLY